VQGVRRGRRALALPVLAVVLVGACTDDGETAPTTTTGVTIAPTVRPPRPDDGELRIGAMLPVTGEGATIGQAMISAVGRAVDEINEAGGVNGEEVVMVTADEGATTASARRAVDTLLDDDVDAIVGPASSTHALDTLGAAVEAGVVTCAPTTTALALDDFPDNGLFFRTAPSDSLQAQAIALLAEQTGASTVALAYLDDTYGRPLAAAVRVALEGRDLDVVAEVSFLGDDESLVDESATINDRLSGVIVVIGDADQGMRMLSAIGEISEDTADREPPDIIVNDSLRRPRSTQLVQSLPQRVRDRVRGVSMTAGGGEDQPDGPFATNAYDCVNLIALAAAQAGSDDPERIAAEVPSVSDRGSTCVDFAGCAAVLASGRLINYEGPAGNLEIGIDGDRSVATFDVFSFDDGGIDRTDRPLVVAG